MTNAQPSAPPPQGAAPVTSTSSLPPELQTANASKDDRTWGTIAHLSALAGCVVPLGNILGPLVVFLVKKDQSPFVAFHAKQAMWLQIFAFIGAAVMAFVGFIICITFPIAAALGLGAMIYAIYAGVRVSSGKDFEYYWVGAWVRRSM